MADYWMKLYIEVLDDPKMATLPDRLWRRIIELFLAAKRYNKDGELPETAQIAWILRVSPDDLSLDLRQIESMGIIKRLPDGGWYVVNFLKRQAAVGTNERVKSHRERKQHEQYSDNEDVTNLKRNVTQRQSQKQNTESEAETETETEREQKDARLYLSPDTSDIQRVLESITGIPVTPDAATVVDQILQMGASREDIQNGYNWLKNQGKQFRYYGSLVGPTRTAMASRRGKAPNMVMAGYSRVGEE